MANRKWIYASRVEGNASRQAHADMPEGTYEREMSKEGFFGPAAFLHHQNPPTGWVKFEGPLQPRAFDLNRLNAAEPSPWQSSAVLHNNAIHVRFWKLAGPMTAERTISSAISTRKATKPVCPLAGNVNAARPLASHPNSHQDTPRMTGSSISTAIRSPARGAMTSVRKAPNANPARKTAPA